MLSNKRTENVIKNINVKNSYFVGSGYTGGLVGGTWSSSIATASLTIENSSVANSYIYNTHTINGGAGAMIGQFGSSSGSPILTVNNCLIYGNQLGNAAGGVDAAITGSSGGINNNSNYRKIKNSVFLDISPATGDYWAGNCVSNPIYTNCYTDTAYIGANAPTYVTGVLEKISPNDAKGIAAKTAMPLLDWDVWFATTSYPVLPEFHNIQTTLTQSRTDWR